MSNLAQFQRAYCARAGQQQSADHLCRVQLCQNIRSIWRQVYELLWAICCPGWLSLQIQRPFYVIACHAPEQRAKPTVFVEIGQRQRAWTRCSFVRYSGELDLLS